MYVKLVALSSNCTLLLSVVEFADFSFNLNTGSQFFTEFYSCYIYVFPFFLNELPPHVGMLISDSEKMFKRVT